MFKNKLRSEQIIKRKRIVISMLCVSIVLSGFSPVTQTFSVNALNNVSQVVTGEKVFDTEPLAEKTKPVMVESSKQKIYEGTEEYGAIIGDQFNLDKNMIDSYINQGATAKDIFMAQDLANKYSFDANKIINLKLHAKKNWNDTEIELQEVIFLPNIERLKKQFPDEYELVKKNGFTLKEQSELLSLYDSNGFGQISMDDMISFRNQSPNGWQAEFVKMFPKRNRGYIHTKDRLNQYGLTVEDGTYIDEDSLVRLEQIADKHNIPPAKLIHLYIKAGKEKKNKSKTYGEGN